MSLTFTCFIDIIVILFYLELTNNMNTELFYTDSGSDRTHAPLILLHGNGGNSSSFFYVVHHFSAFRRVITVDTRGHGRTPKGDKPFTLKQFAVDLREFMTELEIPKAVLIGYSDGGNIAMIFARMFPEMVEGMVLNGANMFPDGLKEYVLRDMQRDYKKLRKALRKNPQNPKARAELDLLSLMIKEPDLTPEQLGKMDMPALVLVGSHDVIKEEHTRLIASSLPRSELAVIDGGHNIVKTNSAAYNEEIEKFLKKYNI